MSKELIRRLRFYGDEKYLPHPKLGEINWHELVLEAATELAKQERRIEVLEDLTTEALERGG